MIVLSEMEAGFLKSMFRGVSDRELVRELLRRGRFGQVQASVIIDDEAKSNLKYFQHMKENLGASVGIALSKETERGYVVTVEPDPGAEGHRPRTILRADVIVLRAPKKESPNADPVDDREA